MDYKINNALEIFMRRTRLTNSLACEIENFHMILFYDFCFAPSILDI